MYDHMHARLRMILGSKNLQQFMVRRERHKLECLGVANLRETKSHIS